MPTIFTPLTSPAILGYLHYPSWLKPEVIPGLMIPRWYSLMYIVTFFIAHHLFRRQHYKHNRLPYDEKEIQNFITYGIISMILGTRLFYTMVYSEDRYYYLTHPWMIYWPFQNGEFIGLQGLSYHGALIGALLFFIIYPRIKKQSSLIWADASIAATSLGQGFVRLGNFTNGELYGRVTSVPWGMVFPQAEASRDTLPTKLAWVQDLAAKVGMEIEGNYINLPRHPSQLYQAFGEGLLLWLIIWFLIMPRKPRPGFLFSAFLSLYGAIRFFLEYFRQPDPYPGYVIQTAPGDISQFTSFGNISIGQLLSAGMVGLGLLLFIGLKIYYRRKSAPTLGTS